jgi:hypothetical protein
MIQVAFNDVIDISSAECKFKGRKQCMQLDIPAL